MPSYGEKHTWELVSRLYLKWLRGRVEIIDQDYVVVEYGLNPFQPTLEFFRHWEGDAGALLRPKALVPRAKLHGA